MDKRSSRDLLSNLPLSIIHTILELLPIREAVQTSILSRQWRYKWATLPNLCFEEYFMRSSETQLKDFISQLLLLHQGPILKFEVFTELESISQNINSWLTFLSRNGVRELNLRHLDGVRPVLSSVYSCQNLTHLELYNADIPPPPPTFNGFLYLRCLRLDLVDMSSETIQNLLSSLNLLEELRLENCASETKLRIHVPNLKIIDLDSVFKDICLTAPVLRVMHIEFEEHVPPETSSVCTYTELLGGLSTLEELNGDLYFFEVLTSLVTLVSMKTQECIHLRDSLFFCQFLSFGIESCHTPLVFPHLRVIELCPETFYDEKIELVLAHLCKGAQFASTLIVILLVQYAYTSHSTLESLRLDSECSLNFTFERLKVIEFGYPYLGNNVGGINHWMKLIKCLLARSPALETLICVRPCMSDGELLKQASILLTYPRLRQIPRLFLESDDNPCSVCISIKFER